MHSIKKITGIFMAAAAILALSGTAGYAKIVPQSAFGSSDLIVLTQNHARTVAYDLNTTAGNPGGLHSIFLLALNLDQSTAPYNLSIICANTTPMTKGDEIIYFISGFVNATPLFQYVYASGGAFGAAIGNVPKLTYGVLFTGVLYTRGVDFPITLVTTITLTPPSD